MPKLQNTFNTVAASLLVDRSHAVKSMVDHFDALAASWSLALLELGKSSLAVIKLQQPIQEGRFLSSCTMSDVDSYNKVYKHSIQLDRLFQKGQEEIRNKLFGDAKGTFGQLLRHTPSAPAVILGAERADMGI
jgi:hypothetical protein